MTIVRFILVAFITVAAYLAFAHPCAFAAQSSELDGSATKSVSLTAEVDTQGILHVTERRIVSFASNGTSYRWAFPAGCEPADYNLAFDKQEPLFIEDADGKHAVDLPPATSRPDNASSYSCKTDSSRYHPRCLYFYNNRDASRRASNEDVAITLKYSIVRKVGLTKSTSGRTNAHLTWGCIGANQSYDTEGISVDITFPAAEGDNGTGGLYIHRDGNKVDDVAVTFSEETHTYTARKSFPLLKAGEALTLGIDCAPAGIGYAARSFTDARPFGEILGLNPSSFSYSTSYSSHTPQTRPTEPTVRPMASIIIVAVVWWFFSTLIIMGVGLSYQLPTLLKRFGKQDQKTIEESYDLPSYDHPAFLAYLYQTRKGNPWIGQGLAAGLADLVRRGWMKVGEDGKSFEFVGVKGESDELDDAQANDLAAKTYVLFRMMTKKDVFAAADICASSSEDPKRYSDMCKAWAKDVEGYPAAKQTYGIDDRSSKAKTLFRVCCGAFALQGLITLASFSDAPLAAIVILLSDLAGIYVLWRERTNAITANQEGLDLLDRCESLAMWLQTPLASEVLVELEPDIRYRYITLAAAFDIPLAHAEGGESTQANLANDTLVKALFGSSSCAKLFGDTFDVAKFQEITDKLQEYASR